MSNQSTILEVIPQHQQSNHADEIASDMELADVSTLASTRRRHVPEQSSGDVPEATSQPTAIPTSAWTLRLVSVVIAINCLSVGIDATIVSTLIPTLTSQFGSVKDVGWYGSAFFLSSTASQLICGQLGSIFPAKWIFVGGVFVFEIGCLLTGLASESSMLIAGRAISGIGFAATTTAGLVITSQITTPRQRPFYVGLNGSMEIAGQAAGPFFGGLVTSRLSWRWAFLINVPIGFAVVCAIVFVLKAQAQMPSEHISWKSRVRDFDWFGIATFLPGVTLLLLSITWGGNFYPWSSGPVIGALAAAVAFLAVFGLLEYRRKSKTLLPFHMFKRRNYSLGVAYAFCTAAAIGGLDYYTPLWLQVVHGSSVLGSGLLTLPSFLIAVVGLLVAGHLVALCGYPNPVMLAGAGLVLVGAGLSTSLSPASSIAKIIGIQVLIGFGSLGMQQPFTIAQTSLKSEETSFAISTIVFANSIGNAIALAVLQVVFLGKLSSTLSNQNIPDALSIINTGASDIRKEFSGELLETILVEYNRALTQTFFVPLGLSACMLFVAAGLGWKAIKND